MEADAVFFDAGHTLIYADPPVGEAYARALRRAGFEADGDEVHRQFEEAWRRLRERQPPGGLAYGGTEAEAKDFWREVVRDSFAPFGMPADFERTFLALWDHFAAASAWRVYDDVVPALEELRRRGKGLGLISNWDVRLAGILEGLGLRGRLDWVVVSCHVHVEKPEPAIFRHAIEQCALPPGRIVHVGNSYEEDVLGGQRAGMGAVWLRRGEPGPADPRAVPTVRYLTELLDLLD
ncbi:MAG: HAD-IA family hydrolase [Planctomycetota bacterium]